MDEKELRKISVTELKEILEKHKLWIGSDYQKGERADFTRATLIGLDFTKAELREAKLTEAKLIKVNFKGADIGRADLRGADLTEADLSGAKLTGAELNNAKFINAKLSGCRLSGAELTDTEFTDANLFSAKLRGARLSGAKFINADLSYVDLTKAHLFRADLTGAKLTKAKLINANFINTDLTKADLTKADLTETNLTNANLTDTTLSGANLKNADVTRVEYNSKGNFWGVRKGRFQGIRVDGCHGSQGFKRFAQDQCFLEEFRERHSILYFLWWLFADCGRSVTRWALWSFLLALVFGLGFYYLLGQEAFSISGYSECSHKPLGCQHLEWTRGTMLYYSIVTFTTLGFGDITPTTGAASFWITFEVIIGYMMLGGLISIFANKIARRS